MTLDRSSLKRSGRFAIDGIRFAPFWIQGRPSDGLRARGEMLQPLKAYPAFAFSWWGTGGKWGGEYGAVLQFIIELASKYEVYNLPDREPLDENVGVQATALQRHTFDLYFDPDCRTETLLSAALGARDSATGQSVVFSMMRACPRLVAFADELILLVVQYLILPCISTEMVEFVEKYEKTVNG
jgi:hypothetical protein